MKFDFETETLQPRANVVRRLPLSSDYSRLLLCLSPKKSVRAECRLRFSYIGYSSNRYKADEAKQVRLGVCQHTTLIRHSGAHIQNLFDFFSFLFLSSLSLKLISVTRASAWATPLCWSSDFTQASNLRSTHTIKSWS